MDMCSDPRPSLGYMVLRIVRSCMAWMNCSIHLSLKFLTFRIVSAGLNDVGLRRNHK